MKLIVCLEGQIAGLVEGDGSTARFTYADTWLNRPGAYPLSYSMPLRSAPFTGRTVLNFLWGLLPDNERTLSTWSRWFQVSARNPLALLSHVGEDCAGAVQFVLEERLEQIMEQSSKATEVEWLEDRELERRLQRLIQDGTAGRTADEGQFSLAGAQPKIALYLDPRGDRWGVPRGRTPTTHILEPVANDFDGFAENEHFCMTLARRVGLAAASTEWRTIGGVPTLIAERYDRVQIRQGWLRIHQEDCCQALGIHPASKYENEGGPGFPQIMALLNSVDEPQVDRDRMMKTACFIFLLAATDMHAKNFSLLHAPGPEGPGMRLAPLYDIASIWPYTPRIAVQKIKLAMRMGGHYKIREILPRHFHQLALACNYASERLMGTLKELARQLPDEAAALAKEVGGPAAPDSILPGLLTALAAQCRRALSA
jgi:serine/threonine-protein kinase HipA